VTRSKALGTQWETAIVRCLNEHGWPRVERRTLAGANDKGDIAGLPVVVEAKNAARLDLAGWVREANIEARNAGVRVGVVWAKRRGKASPLDGYVVMDGRTFMRVLDELRGATL
jgi:hypothetical protein